MENFDLIIIGAGPVGLEFAQMFARFGTKVTILQRSGSIFRPAERDLTDRLQELLAKEGISILLNANIKRVEKQDDKKVVAYEIPPAGEQRVAADEILLAGVGLTEEAQIKQMGICACRTVSFVDVPKAIIMHRTEGLIKMIVHPQTSQILGVHILAPNAGELIAAAMMLIKNKNTIDDVVNSLPMFPTLSEAIKLVALSFTKDVSKLSCCI